MPVMAQPAKPAEPPVAALGLAVQANVPPGLVPMARVIELVAVVTKLPETSSTATVGWVAHDSRWLRRRVGWCRRAWWPCRQ